MSFLSQVVEIIHPVRCSCGKIFSVEVLNKYHDYFETAPNHLEAAIYAGFLRECCLVTLTSPRQIPSRIEVAPFPVRNTEELSEFQYPPVMIRPAELNIPVSPEDKTLNYRTPLIKNSPPNFGFPTDLIPYSIYPSRRRYKIPSPPDYSFTTPWGTKKKELIPSRVIVLPKRDLTKIVRAKDIRHGTTP